MKTTSTLVFAVILSLFAFTSCSKDDDSNNGGQQQQQSNEELLTTGKWYLESNTAETYTACQKKSYVQFMANDDFVITSYDDNSGTCETTGPVTATYTLTNAINIHIALGTDAIDAVINAISADELTITTDEGVTQVFDRTEG